jgi:hypothetical protein
MLFKKGKPIQMPLYGLHRSAHIYVVGVAGDDRTKETKRREPMHFLDHDAGT